MTQFQMVKRIFMVSEGQSNCQKNHIYPKTCPSFLRNDHYLSVLDRETLLYFQPIFGIPKMNITKNIHL